MFNPIQRARIALICLISLPFSAAWAREGGGGGGGFRGGGGRGGALAAGGAHSSPGPSSAPHAGAGASVHGAAAAGPAVHGSAVHGPVGSGPAAHGAVGIHGGGPEMHRGAIGGNHVGYVAHGGHEAHYAAMMHAPGPHWNSYHQAFVGNHPVHLAWGGYRPSYYYHPWYHGPWGGHAWGWGWGFGPGVTFGLAGGAVAIGVGSGWGYPAYYGPYGRYGYWGRPLGWGFGGWGLGTTVYSSGYYSYYNPYYVSMGYPTVVYNYSQPIPVAVQAPPGAPLGGLPGAPPVYANSDPNLPAPSSAPPPDNPAFDAARESFKRGDYQSALANVDSAISRNPSDAVMHEFRSLVLFAMRDYRQSAAVAHSVLAVGPGWDWTTMSTLYPDPLIYSDQLRHLEIYTREHPRAADAHFLLGYHCMIGSRREAAAAELQQAVRLMPNDRLAGELLLMVQGPPKQAPTIASPSIASNTFPSDRSNTFPSDPTPIPDPVDVQTTSPTGNSTSPIDNSPPPFDKSLLPGTWNASREGGSKFRLTMTDDGKFSWKFAAPNQKVEEFTGTYSVDGPVIVLERKEGGALAGTATFNGDTHMNFKLVGGPPDDKGLDFGK